MATFHDFLNDDELLDDLQLDGLMIIQKKNSFKFGIDAVLVANFAKAKKGDVIVDFGSGTGVIPLIASAKTKAERVVAFEIQKDMVEMSRRSVEMNKLGSRIEILHEDIKNAPLILGKASVDVVISNPPYFKRSGAIVNPNDYKAISRHEVLVDLETICSSASQILKPGGSLYMIHRPDRLADIVYHLRNSRLEPKIIRFVQPRIGAAPNLLLIKAVRGGNAELRFENPLIVYNEDGSFTDELKQIYSSKGDNDER